MLYEWHTVSFHSIICFNYEHFISFHGILMFIERRYFLCFYDGFIGLGGLFFFCNRRLIIMLCCLIDERNMFWEWFLYHQLEFMSWHKINKFYIIIEILMNINDYAIVKCANTKGREDFGFHCFHCIKKLRYYFETRQVLCFQLLVSWVGRSCRWCVFIAPL